MTRGCLLFYLFLLTVPSWAAESGRSTYGAASAADFGAGIVPEKPGLHLRTDVSYYDGDLEVTALGGAVDVEADLSAWVVTPRFLWSTGLKLFGARHGFYVSLPFATGESHAEITTRLPGQAQVTQISEGEETNLGDIYVTPLALTWKLGDWQVKLHETVTVPSGTYDVDQPLNISRNHFSLLSGIGATYRKGTEGVELNLRSGYIVNWENPDTDYTSGDEVFADGSLTWRFSPVFALGVTGYAYEQVTGDEGPGALLGDFEGRVYAAGPVMRYIFSVREQRFILFAKWLHEFDAVDRFEGDLFMVSVVTSL